MRQSLKWMLNNLTQANTLLLFWMVCGAKEKGQALPVKLTGSHRCIALVCVVSKQSHAHKGTLASTLQTADTSLKHYVLNSSVFQKGIVGFFFRGKLLAKRFM